MAPVRKIVSQLCGVGKTTVSKCISGASKSGGSIRSVVTRGRKEMHDGCKDKNQEPDIGSLFGRLQGRIADVRKSGMGNARSNPHQ